MQSHFIRENSKCIRESALQIHLATQQAFCVVRPMKNALVPLRGHLPMGLVVVRNGFHAVGLRLTARFFLANT